MVKQLIAHQWKESTRSAMWKKNLGTNIFFGFMIFMLILNLLWVGLFIDKILKDIAPNTSPVIIFNGFIIFYLGLDLILRFLLGKTHNLSVLPYLNLPLKRSKLVHFLLSKSLLSIFNYLPLFIIFPFTIKVLIPEYSTGVILTWFASIFLLIFCNNFLITYIKRKLIKSPLVIILFSVALLGAGLLDYFQLFSLSKVSSCFFGEILFCPYLIIAPISLLSILYWMNYACLHHSLYIDTMNDPRKSNAAIRRFNFLSNSGELGELLALELKLIFRNKRLKSIIYFGTPILLMGFYFYTSDDISNVMLIYIGSLFTGIFMVSYCQFMLCWESGYFDKILSIKIDLLKYFKVKLLVIIGSCTINYLLLLAYTYYGTKIFYINSALFLFNLGINSFILMFLSTFNRKRINLNVNAFSMQDKEPFHALAILVLVILPIIICLPFGMKNIPYAGLIILGVLGLLGLSFSRFFLNLILKRFLSTKYEIAEAFRQN